MQVRGLSMLNFRCFESAQYSFDRQVVLIEGSNGVGKTALLEALHYACYLKSFRTHLVREMIAFGAENCVVQLDVLDEYGIGHAVQVGCSPRKRTVKVDGKNVRSYKELLQHVRVVSLTDTDMQLVRGGPEMRRGFIDQYIFVHEPDFLKTMRDYDSVVAHRNALLQCWAADQLSYEIWTKTLWEQARHIQQLRVQYLQQVELGLRKLLERCPLLEGSVSLAYMPKKELGETFQRFMAKHGPSLLAAERRVQRSLFGVHLDDISMVFNGHASRAFASRGQQKLLALLLKIVQAIELTSLYGSCIFVLDDFMLDFDEKRLDILLDLLSSLNCQLFFTSAQVSDSLLARKLGRFGVQRIFLEGATGLAAACQSLHVQREDAI